MLTLLETLLIGGAAILLLLGIVEAVARVGVHASFLASGVLGADTRRSTSKTFIFMWTLLVGWALSSLLIAGEILSTHHWATLKKVAVAACHSQRDQIGLIQIGWHNFLSSGLAGSYLVLLGIPAAAGVSAKAITQSKADSGT